MKLVGSVFGHLSEVEWGASTFRFRAEGQLSFAKLVALSVLLKTEAIDVDLGRSGEDDFSDVTPGERGYGGWITVHLTDRSVLEQSIPSEREMRLLDPAKLCARASAFEVEGLMDAGLRLRAYAEAKVTGTLKCCIDCGTTWAGRDEEHTVGCPRLEGLGS